MTSRLAPIVFRLVFAALAIAAMAVQLFVVHIPMGFNVANFFSYFTNLSNIMISVVFIITAVRLVSRRSAPTQAETAVRGAAVVYIAFVGFVFNTLLRNAELGALLPWVNVVLHFILPIVAVIDWLAWPPMNRLPFSVVFWWMIWPAVYSIFSIVRGAIDGVYPYFFYNPAAVGGYGGVAALCAVLIVGFFIVGVAVWLVGNWRGGHLRKISTSAAT